MPVSKLNLFSIVFYSMIISGIDITVSRLLAVLTLLYQECYFFYTSVYNISWVDGGFGVHRNSHP